MTFLRLHVSWANESSGPYLQNGVKILLTCRDVEGLREIMHIRNSSAWFVRNAQAILANIITNKKNLC